MDSLHLDFEFRSEIDLTERGLDNVLRHPSTTILMMAWAINDHAVRLWEPHRSAFPAECREALNDPFVAKHAWNVAVERGLLKHKLGLWVPYDEWRDPMVHARHLSMPGKLSEVGKVLGLEEDEKKDAEGNRLIDLFCFPAVPATEGGLFGSTPASFRDWNTNPVEWAAFGDYCKQDVVAERANDKKLDKIAPFPESEQRLWVLDQIINEAGIPADLDLVRGARAITGREMLKLRTELRNITQIENPNSTEQMLAWVKDQGYPFGSLGKGFVARAYAGEGDLTPLGRKVLEIRAMTSKSAVHKFTAIADNVSDDGRLRGQFVFGGASRTQRWCLAADTSIHVQDESGVVLERPIQQVQKTDMVWDGVEWVYHDGVVFSGDKEVVTWDGLTATREHRVWVSSVRSLPFGVAADFQIPLWGGR